MPAKKKAEPVIDPNTVSAVMRHLGRKGGAASRSGLSEEEKTRLAKAAAEEKWKRYYAANPDKLQAKREREARKKRSRM